MTRLVWTGGPERFQRQFQEAQRWLDKTVLRDASPFVPKRSGRLEQSGVQGTAPGKGVVRWTAPYAAAVYEGKVMKGPRRGPKYRSNQEMKMSKATHPLARSMWFEAAKARYGQMWVRGVRKRAGGG